MNDTIEKISNIAKDFDMFCNYIDNNHVKLSNKREIGRKDLFEINKSLYFKSDVSSLNYPQKSYELINLLFHVCKNSCTTLKYEGLEFVRIYIKDLNRKIKENKRK